MGVRIVLVAFVVVLGLELPGSDELAAWGRSGREWVSDAMASLTSVPTDPDGTKSEVPGRASAESLQRCVETEAASARIDLAFDAAVEATVSGFPADLASMGSRPPLGALTVRVEPEAESEPDSVPSVVVAQSTARDHRLENISTAFSLTIQAVNAWASLLLPAPYPSDQDSQGDSL